MTARPNLSPRADSGVLPQAPECGPTPGPWSACHAGKCKCKAVWSIAADHPVAEITSGEWGDRYAAVRLTSTNPLDAKAEAYIELDAYGSVDEAVAEANARLIAAAPCLLSACKAFVEAWEKSLQLEKTDVALRMAKDAIAKAEGR
jgi:hypothetical protein